MNQAVLTNDPWIARLQSEESQPAALAELRVLLMRGLRSAFRGGGGGESFCEDVAQDTLIRILDKIDQFSGRSKFTTWAMSIAVRIGTSRFRRKMFQDVSLDSVNSSDNMKLDVADESTVQPETQQDRHTILKTLADLIKTSLTDRQRQATEALMQGLPVEEIAERTGSNRNAVYKLVHDARLRLKHGLETAGYSGDDVLSIFA